MATIISVASIKTASIGRWYEILVGLGMDPLYLTGKHHACPFCGGQDRWRWDNKDGSGSGICSQCGSGDGLMLAARVCNMDPKRDFPAVLARVAAMIGVVPALAGGGEKKLQPEKDVGQAVTPIPVDAPAPPLVHRTLGRPVGRWEYRNDSGLLLCLFDRYLGRDGGKVYLPLTYRAFADGSSRWSWKGLPHPWPLYGLDRLAARPGAKVLICEGEKAADAGGRIMLEYVVISSSNGATNARLADWTPMKGRSVTIWPDHDDPGARYADDVVRLANQVGGASSVQVVTPPPDTVEGWDLADAEVDGWSQGDVQTYLDENCYVSPAVVPASTSNNVSPAVVPASTSNNVSPAVVPASTSNNGRKTIYLKGSIEDCAQTIMSVVVKTGGGAYVWGETLAYLCSVRGQTVLKVLDAQKLQVFLSRRFDFFQDQAKGGTKPIILPITMCNYLLDEPEWPFPVIEQVIRSPVFGADGSLVLITGYHPAAQAYIDLAGLSVPHVPEIPTENDVATAKSWFDELLFDFPFADSASRANAISLYLLPYIRRLIDGNTPLFLVSAPVQGTGKTMLVDAVSLISTGQEATMMTEGRDDEEWRKRITSILIRSPSVIKIDNINRKIDSGAFATLLTTRIWEDRLLGSSNNISVVNNTIWTATANNPVATGEIARRIVWIRLNPETEQPWSRTGFRHDPFMPWVVENRMNLLWSCLVLIRHWLAVGSPMDKSVSFGSFSRWTQISGGILKSVGIAGFLGNLSELYDRADAETAEWREFVGLWWQFYGSSPVSAGSLYDILDSRSLLESVMGDGNDRSRKIKLGLALQKAVDRYYAGYCICTKRDTNLKIGLYFLWRRGAENTS